MLLPLDMLLPRSGPPQGRRVARMLAAFRELFPRKLYLAFQETSGSSILVSWETFP
ncbi:MAG TPA: hypothetical protein VGN43_07105 [Steroidobacteraceae bacterium]|jgi:hypothetical protein|nr:hypothetical protein [Steroidobacteraceae bacterium]